MAIGRRAVLEACSELESSEHIFIKFIFLKQLCNLSLNHGKSGFTLIQNDLSFSLPKSTCCFQPLKMNGCKPAMVLKLLKAHSLSSFFCKFFGNGHNYRILHTLFENRSTFCCTTCF